MTFRFTSILFLLLLTGCLGNLLELPDIPNFTDTVVIRVDNETESAQVFSMFTKTHLGKDSVNFEALSMSDSLYEWVPDIPKQDGILGLYHDRLKSYCGVYISSGGFQREFLGLHLKIKRDTVTCQTIFEKEEFEF